MKEYDLYNDLWKVNYRFAAVTQSWYNSTILSYKLGLSDHLHCYNLWFNQECTPIATVGIVGEKEDALLQKHVV